MKGHQMVHLDSESDSDPAKYYNKDLKRAELINVWTKNNPPVVLMPGFLKQSLFWVSYLAKGNSAKQRLATGLHTFIQKGQSFRFIYPL